MARYSETELIALKQSVDLAALIQSRGIALTKHGSKDLKGLCPFHNDTNPSLIVSPRKNLWNCPACGTGGDVIKFVELHDGVSFRHAVELLKNGHVVGGPGQAVKKSTVTKLPSPVELDADDHAQLAAVIDYYHQRLLETEPAHAYLKKRGIFNSEAIKTFKLGYADRTLGLRLPDKQRKSGAILRAQLEKIGIYRDTGREHLNGCLVIPVIDTDGTITEVYGRKLNDTNRHRGCPSHLYLPGPHRGVWNPSCLSGSEVILCESLIDALTLWCCGLRNVTASYGTGGLTDEIVNAIVDAKVKTISIAYDADEPGNRAAKTAGRTFMGKGIETRRVRLPHGMDVNAFVIDQGDNGPDAIRHAVAAAEWIGATAATAPSMALSPPEPRAQAVSTRESLAAKLEAAASNQPQLEHVGNFRLLTLGNRQYRVGGLDSNNSLDVLRISLRLCHNDLFHLDTVDLAVDNHRRRFIERAAEETRLDNEQIKRDLGRLLLLLEHEQHQRLSQASESLGESDDELTDDERNDALAFLQAPNLIARIDQAFDQCGLVGETTNRLAAYLACTSRKLPRPLAVIIQSTSAAGKSTLMDAVLAMFPTEQRVEYSAMTGQSLYYLGETDIKHKILAISEEEGAEKASYALKLLQSEGKLTIASTGKDPKTGRLETQQYHVEGPVMIFLTTTAIDIDEELQNRCLTLCVDESSDQTKRIHAMQRQARTLDGLRRRKEKERTLCLLRNAQKLLEPVDVVNAFAEHLTFTAGRTRARRDHEKYLTLIDAIALLHQHQRKKHTLPGDDRPFIHATVDDVELANRLAQELLGRCLDDLPPQPRRMLEAIKELVRERAQAEHTEPELVRFSRRDVRLCLGWSVTQTRVHLERLQQHECIVPRRGRFGQAFSYQLLIDPTIVDAVTIGLTSTENLRLRHQPDGIKHDLTGT